MPSCHVRGTCKFAQLLNARCPPTSSDDLPSTLKLINLKTSTSPFSAIKQRQLHFSERKPSFQVFPAYVVCMDKAFSTMLFLEISRDVIS